MNPNYLDFEQPIAELEGQIQGLQVLANSNSTLQLGDEIRRLEQKSLSLTEEIFANLNAAQVTQLARHPKRPYTLDYISHIFTDFDELHGDRSFRDDPSIVGGLARFQGEPVMVIGHQKGRDVRERARRNFGMPNPEGYRKALRLMEMAERFKLPIFSFIDTPGAYPGIEAEERGQSEAIARNLAVMSRLKVPIICTVIGEGGSGGALAIGVGDALIMLQYSIYSVISPEGCAAILWKTPEKAGAAAEAMGLTAQRLNELGFVDELIPEPLGGAHRDTILMAETLRKSLAKQLKRLRSLDSQVLCERRLQRIMSYGVL
ncbi:acetyl-CoA carboxylase carboxyltransferase subunit alpha [Agitococcus lubricus]|uniref:Acetyl-coenzyme A carboxylase carboxyl transferase subunit alpha n=1 Tax=Agitococcus lubricus TaxID=1077255 RepID=A0A2T5J2A2_9GAMM|nr:acetyl-CoA carboxylase carboxyltransferase subunit alpha [Agitococcus lubricus]PTQ90666.1 acetyl-CoA carboxylase carboxyltransferase subunit alpha [Agitococcus lubricus]